MIKTKKETRILTSNPSKIAKSKRSQITIFIIIAILLVAAILLFFFMLRQRNIEIQNQLNPVNYIDKCVRDNVEQAENIMLAQAGYINPEKYILFNNNKVAYLCYNKNYYQACVNQEPVYIESLQQEIRNYIKPKIEECFYSLQQELQKRNYQIEQGSLSLNVEVVPNLIQIGSAISLVGEVLISAFDEFIGSQIGGQFGPLTTQNLKDVGFDSNQGNVVP